MAFYVGLYLRREADRVSSVPKASVKALLARIATVARSKEGPLGPVSVDDMRVAFRDVCGYEPEEEGLQLLLRLPGLASGTSGGGAAAKAVETRRFVDADLSDAAYGEDVAAYIRDPYAIHPLAQASSSNEAASELVAGVAAASLADAQFEAGIVSGAIKRRSDLGYFDATLMDCVSVAETFGSNPVKNVFPYLAEVIIPRLRVSGDAGYLSLATFSDCVIDTLDVTDLEGGQESPQFQECLIGRIEGWATVPPDYQGHLRTSEVLAFSAASQTTAGLADAGVAAEDSVALVILKKVYKQAGTARKESALPRGLPLNKRELVAPVAARLVSAGYLTMVTRRSETLVLAVKGRRGEVDVYLNAPRTFSLESLAAPQ